MFDSKLENTVRNIKGGRAAILMGFDGIPVDSYQIDDSIDIETVGMEFSVVLKEIRKAAELLEAGKAEEIMVRTDKMLAVLRVVNESYFLAMALEAGGNVGKARFLLRMLAPEFSGDMF